MNMTDIKNMFSGLLNTGGGLLGWATQFVTKYANTLLLIALVWVVSKVTSGNKLQVKI